MGTSEGWYFPSAARAEMRKKKKKHFIFDKWDAVFFLNLFASKMSYESCLSLG